MPLTLEEITEREDALRLEIAEREHLLAAYQLIRADRTKMLAATPVRALPATPSFPLLEDRAQPISPAAPANPVGPKIHPELARISRGHGGTGRVVSWAIQQMSADYTLRDIAEALKREGYPVQPERISVVLTRLKARGEIEELSRGRGRTSAVFRAPVSATTQPAEIVGQPSGNAATVEPDLVPQEKSDLLP